MISAVHARMHCECKANRESALSVGGAYLQAAAELGSSERFSFTTNLGLGAVARSCCMQYCNYCFLLAKKICCAELSAIPVTFDVTERTYLGCVLAFHTRLQTRTCPGPRAWTCGGQRREICKSGRRAHRAFTVATRSLPQGSSTQPVRNVKG